MNKLKLNELNLDNVGQWPLAIKIGVVSVVSCILIGMGYWLIAKANFEQYKSLQAKEVTLKTDFEIKQRQAVNLQAYRNQMQIMEERFGDMLKQLPTETEMPGLLEEISKTGIASGLTFELFAPQPEIQHDFYIEVPISIVVAGTYHQLAVFLNRVAKMSRIVTLHDFVIEGAPSDASKNTPSEERLTGDKLVMKMTAKIYRYHSS